jgi:hypothetical protein
MCIRDNKSLSYKVRLIEVGEILHKNSPGIEFGESGCRK